MKISEFFDNVGFIIQMLVGFGIAIFMVIVIATLGWNALTSQKDMAPQRAIVTEVKGLIDNCRTAGDHVTIKGKVIVWDMQKDVRSGAYNLLPDSLQANSKDKLITVFMVMGERIEQVGTYNISHQLAYRQYVDVAVVLWPDKKPVGFHSVISKEPRSSRPVEQVPEYGDPNGPIADWIKTLRQVSP